MSERGYFADPDPNDHSVNPHLPETYFPQTIDGMMPGQIAYLLAEPELIIADRLGTVYLNLDYGFRADIAERPDYSEGGNIAILRIYQVDDDGAVCDGYIVDLRTAEPGDVAVYPKADEEELIDNNVFPVLGLISNDEVGNSHYASAYRKETLQEAERLAKAVDAAVLAQTSADSRKKRAAKKEAETQKRDNGGSLPQSTSEGETDSHP